MSLAITPLDCTCGAEVTGIDLKQPSSPGEDEAIQDAFDQHAVLVFREQHLNDQQQIDFSKRFGQLERLITKRAKNPAIAALANVDQDGRVIPRDGSRALFLKGNTFWHTDSSFKRVPAKASLLSARVVPGEGCQSPRTFRHAWRTGDLVLWDNRCVLHRGREWDPDQPRVMHRTTIAGEQGGNEWSLGDTGAYTSVSEVRGA